MWAAERPNILFIMSDDHTTQAVGAYARTLKPLNPTPELDRLASEGIVFDNAFCVNAICTPSRASIITGQYPHTHGVFDLRGQVLPANQTLPILMRQAGYQTAIVGKWHLKQEPNFDFYKVLPGQGKYLDPVFRIQGPKAWPANTVEHPGEHSSDAITDATLDWLRHHRDPDQPFFLCHQFKAPHDFFENAPRYQSYLKDVEIPEPPSLYDVPSTFGSLATRGFGDELMPHIGTSIGKRNPRRSYAVDLHRLYPEEFPSDYDLDRLSEEETTHLAYQAYLKKYLRCVKGVDDNLKRLFDYLKDAGLYDNTLIIYTVDNGAWQDVHPDAGMTPFRGTKGTDREGAYRVPFIAKWDDTIAAGTECAAPICHVDLFATCAELIGRPRLSSAAVPSSIPAAPRLNANPTDATSLDVAVAA